MSIQKKFISDALDYSSTQKQYAHSSVVLQKVAADNGGSLTISSGGGDQSRFLIPTSKGLHFDRDVLKFTATPTATTNYAMQYVSNIMLQTIQLNTISGVQIQNLQNLNYMMDLLCQPCSSFSTLQCSSSNSNFVELAPYSTRSVGTAAIAGAGNRVNNTVTSAPYLERAYVIVGENATATPVVNFAFKMSNLPASIWSVDQICMFNESLELILTWASPAQMYFDCSTAVLSGTKIAYAGTTVAVTNLIYYSANEMNSEVNASLRDEVNSETGLSILIPNMVTNRIVTPASTSHSLNINFTAGQGSHLKKVWVGCYHATLTIANTYNHDNTAQAKITSFTTLVNNTNTTAFAPVTCANAEDYFLMKPYLEGSAVMDQSQYNYSWFWCDVFDNDSDRKFYDKSPVKSGLSLLEGPINWQLVATTANAGYTWFVFGECLKTLNVSRNGVRCM